MNKAILLLLITLTAGGLIFSAGITVKSPNAGTVWTAGSTGLITWNCNAAKTMDMKINIFRNTVSQANFVVQLKSKNTGKITWAIPAGFQAGKYVLRVKTGDNKLKGDSGVFTVKGKASPPPDPPAPPSGNTMIPDKIGNPVHRVQQDQFKLKDPPRSMMALQDMLKPDLVVKEIMVITEQPVPADVSEILVTVVVKNIGAKDILKMSDWFAIDINNKSGLGGTSMNYGGGLKAGDVKVFSGMKVQLQRTLPGFKPEFTVILDKGNKLVETSETNNSKDFSVKIK